MRSTERLTPVAAAMSALATLACCLPLGIGGAVAALGLSVALDALRPWLIGLAVVLLGISSYRIYTTGKICRRRSRISLVLFGLSAAVVVAVIVFPQKVAEVMAGSRAPSGQPQLVVMNNQAISALQAEFNRTSAGLRVIVLLSPT